MSEFSRNVPLLATGQALMMSSLSLILTTSALVGLSLAPDKSLATLPITFMFIAGMCTSIPAAMLMERIGRKQGFLFSTIFGISGGVAATFAIINQDFWLFAFSGVLIGMFNGFGNYYRFAAADAVETSLKSKAISTVLIGGVAAAVIGPNLANLTRESITDAPFAGSYLSIIVVYALVFVALAFIKLPAHANRPHSEDSKKGRSLKEIASQPKYIVALICAMLGYGVMSFVMTATPLAMNHSAHSFSDTSWVIQWHVLGMYVPSFFTGHLINKFGVIKVMVVGALFGLACMGTNLLGTSVTHYWFALVLLGVGWNFLFIGGTTLLTETYRLEERGKAQALNDFSIFTMVAISSITAGALQNLFGWQVINIAAIPFLVIILLSLVWLSKQRHQEALVHETRLEEVPQE